MIEKILNEIAKLCLYNDKIESDLDKGLYTGLMGLAIFSLEYNKYLIFNGLEFFTSLPIFKSNN